MRLEGKIPVFLDWHGALHPDWSGEGACSPGKFKITETPYLDFAGMPDFARFILRHPDVQLVITSLYRSQQVPRLRSRFPKAVHAMVVDPTPDMGGNRWAEIRMWLVTHGNPPGFVIIDSKRGFYPEGLKTRIVKPSADSGLTRRDYFRLSSLIERARDDATSHPG